MTDEQHLILKTLSKSEYFYTGEEVDKLIRAFQDKYNISQCDGLPYNPKAIRAFVGLQIIDTEKLKV